MQVTSEQFDRVCCDCSYLGQTKKVDWYSDGSVSIDCFDTICPVYLLSKASSGAMQGVWCLLTGNNKPFQQVWDEINKKKRHKELTFRERRAALNHQRLLFNSLLEHTGTMGWWEAFKQYKEAWDRCILAYAEPRNEAIISEMQQKMEKSIEKIEHDLDPLVLRPQVLRTRCELCPV